MASVSRGDLRLPGRPQFSTRAESNVYRSLGFSVIGLTALPEAKLAREAEICYASVALATDYDVWKEEEVTVEMVIGNDRQHIPAKPKKDLKPLIGKYLEERGGKQSIRARIQARGREKIVTSLFLIVPSSP